MQQNRNFKKITLAVAVASAFHAGIAVAADPAFTIPEGMTSVDAILKGPAFEAGQWSGTLNNQAIDSSHRFNIGYMSGPAVPESLKSFNLTLNDFKEAIPGNVAYFYNVTNPLTSTIAINNATRLGNLNALTVIASTVNNLSAKTAFTNITLNPKEGSTPILKGIHDSGTDVESRRTYGTVETDFENIQSETGMVVGLQVSGQGKAIIDQYSQTIKGSNIGWGIGARVFSDGTFNAFNMVVEDSELSKTLYGIYADSSGKTKPVLQLNNGMGLTVKNSTVGSSIYAVYQQSLLGGIDGDVTLNIQGSSSETGKSTALYVTPDQKYVENTWIMNGNVTTNVSGGSSAFEYTAITLSTKDNANISYATEFNNSRIALNLQDATSPRIRTLVIYNSLDQGDKPHLTLNNGSMELFMDGVKSGTGDRTEDNPTVMCLGSNANVELNNSDVLLTLRANKENAFSNQSIYGIAMHGSNTKVKLTGDIVVTLEGDAKNLGFGVKADGTTKEVGGIFAVGKQNIETSVFEQTGDRILQFGSADHAFISSETNGLAAPFANFTHVSVGTGSSLYLTNTQSDTFVHDDAFGNSGPILNAVGVSAKGGNLSIAGSNDPNEVGIRLSKNSTLHASKIDFTGQATVASTGSSSLLGDTIKIASDAKVNFKTLDATQANAVNLSGTIDNQGIFSLEGSGIALSADKNQTVNLGKVETVGQKESAVYVGSGNLTIEDLKGDNKSVVVTDLEKTESVVIQNNSGQLNLAASSSANDQFASAQEAANALADKFNVAQSDQDKHQFTVNEGTLNDGVSGAIDKDGNVSDLVFYKNSTLDAYGTIATLSAFQWRHDMNDLTKRMGELRLSPSGIGSWARIYGSEQTYGAQNITAKNHSVQVGVDADVGNGWKAGVAFSYTDGQSTYAKGKGDNKAYGFAAYGTWLADNGQFVDLIAKYSRLNNDFEVNAMSGDYQNNAYSVSAEYGWHLKLSDVAFVEPQVELTYGKVIGDDFTAQDDIRITQDDFESLIGRVGGRSGFYFSDNKGVIYARASALHDFKGEMSSVATNGLSTNSVEHDIGGTWFELGLGANFNITPNSYIYVDLERTNGGSVVEDWRYNAGFRYAF